MECCYCGKEFDPKVFWQKYCGGKCKWKAWDEAHPRQRNKEALKEANKVFRVKK